MTVKPKSAEESPEWASLRIRVWADPLSHLQGPRASLCDYACSMTWAGGKPCAHYCAVRFAGASWWTRKRMASPVLRWLVGRRPGR